MLIEAFRHATSVAVAAMDELAAQFDDPWEQLVAIVEVVAANIAGLLHPVVLGHLAPQATDYRDVVLAQLAFALATNTENAAGTAPQPTQER